jgi:hypothetical protein
MDTQYFYNSVSDFDVGVVFTVKAYSQEIEFSRTRHAQCSG